MLKYIRPIRVSGNIAFIPLTQGLEAIIDIDDVHLVEGRNWFAHRDHYTFYAKTTKKGDKNVKLRLHNEIMLPPEGFFVDHINGSGLDNRRSNLRLATITENNRNTRLLKSNTSGLKGASWSKRDKKWKASIKVNKVTIYLGYFSTKEAAHEAYRRASLKYHGNFGSAA